jgi:4-amino-4-deoxy-L-arabinose transferase-like glycosyltransferase
MLPVLVTVGLSLPIFTVALSQGGLRGDEGIYGLVVGNLLGLEDPKNLTIEAAEYVNKPPLALWAMTTSARLFGLDEGSLRLPSALLSLVAVGALVALCRAASGLKASLLAGALLATAPGYLFLHGGRAATMESWQLAFWTLGMLAVCGGSGGLVPRHIALAAAFAGLFLSKGLGGGLLLALSAGVASRSASGSRAQPEPPSAIPLRGVLTSALVGLAPLLVWWSLRFDSTGAAGEFLWRDILLRFGQGIRAPLSAPTIVDRVEPWLLDFGPTLLLAAAAFLPGRNLGARPDSRPLRRAALAALIAVFLYQLVTAQPRPWYPYLSYPALCLLCVLGLDRLAALRGSRNMALGAWFAASALLSEAAIRVETGRRLVEASYGESLADWVATMRAIPQAEILVDPDVAVPGQRPREWNRFYLAALPASSWRLPTATDDGTCKLLITGNPRLAEALASDRTTTRLELRPQAAREHRLWGVDLCDGRVRSHLARHETSNMSVGVDR